MSSRGDTPREVQDRQQVDTPANEGDCRELGRFANPDWPASHAAGKRTGYPVSPLPWQSIHAGGGCAQLGRVGNDKGSVAIEAGGAEKQPARGGNLHCLGGEAKEVGYLGCLFAGWCLEG